MNNNNTVNCLFYGTLRKNGSRDKTYNFNRFGGQKLIKEVKIKGFNLYNLGYYPCAVEGDGEITCELHEVESQKSFSYLRNMELSAGYKEKEVSVDGVNACIFVMENLDKNRYSKIIDGDWCKE